MGFHIDEDLIGRGSYSADLIVKVAGSGLIGFVG